MTAIVPSTQGRVLLIDDDELIAGSLRQYLCRQGVDVDVAVEHDAATKMMRAQRYGVVVVDPYLTGGVHLEEQELIDSISSLQPAAEVIVVTGYGSPELAQRATDSKLSLLAKPQSVVALSELIVKGLSR
jgi:DNA-binding NtrC family response regulator